MKKLSFNDVRAYLKPLGWEEDRYGNLKKPSKEPGRTYRIKFQSISVRLEISVPIPATEYLKASTSWVKFGGAYLKDIHYREDGRMVIGRHVF